MKKTLFFMAVALMFSACAQTNQASVQNTTQQRGAVYGYDSIQNATISAFGDGVPPFDTYTPAQARALAKRAAIADAQRQLASKLFGVQITAKDTVRDAMLKNSAIDARVQGLIKNAAIVDEQYKEGLYRVEMEIRMDRATWERIFAY